MTLSFERNVIGLSAETPEEQEICALLCAADGYVFRLHATSERGMAFSEIGPEDDARRASLNIVRTVESRFAPISNLAHTPFSRTIPGVIMADIWMHIRTRLREDGGAPA